MLERQLQRLFDDPKQVLQRAVGEDNANTLLTHARNANDKLSDIKSFEPEENPPPPPRRSSRNSFGAIQRRERVS
jgi:hypothetical protein